MQRVALVVAMMLTCVLTAALNVAIAHYTTLNVFTFSVWLVVPIGALFVGAAAASGAALAAWTLHVRPSWLQAGISAVLVGIGTMWLIYYIQYATLMIDGKQISDYVGFAEYVDISITKAHMRVGRGQHDTGELGELGYWIAVIELVGFVVGAFAIFAILDSLPSCKKCVAYMRRLRSTTSKPLTANEAAVLHDEFSKGDLPAVRAALAWEPEEQKLPKEDPKARLLFKLFQCPKCTDQMMQIDVEVAKKGNTWEETKGLKVRRLLATGDKF